MMQREVERALTTIAQAPGISSVAPASPSTRPVVPPGVAASQLAGSLVNSCKYVGFEDTFRGSADEIRRRLSDYLPLFAGASDVLDLGCGRGEFLDLLREHSVTGRGVDINHEMVEVCRERQLDVVEGDGLTFLEQAPDASLGGLFASQVVEHLQPDQLLRLLSLAFHKLRPGALVVLETINPACWFAFFESYIRDITHVRPIHPDTLKFLLRANGFQRVDIQFRAPYPERGKLQLVPVPDPIAGDKRAIRPAADLAETFNANVDKINHLLFTHLDYAAIGVRP
ncbi:MAG: class I SAM-dependent methyltransferase [Acidobacteria bacterium]|nr:class I SAM-dependent methyltransferase [Acidobacteriota bacterium]